MIILGINVIDWFMLVLYLLGITALGFYSRRAIHSREDFFVGGRRFGKWMMAMHAFGTGTHTDQAAATAAKSYQEGLAGIWAQWLWMFATPIYWLMAPLFRRMRCLTIADFYKQRYGSSATILYVLVGSFALTLDIGILLNVTAQTVAGITDNAIPFGAALAIMTVLFLIYGMAGGIVAAIRTDFVQGLFIIALSFMAIPFALQRTGGFVALRDALPEGFTSLVGSGELSLALIVALCINAPVSIVAMPHVISTTSAGKTEFEGRFGMTYGNFLKRLCTVGWCVLGLAALVLFSDQIREPDQAFGYAIGELLPVGFAGVMLACLMAGAMACCDSLMVAISGLYTENVYKQFIAPDKSERHYVTVGRIVSGIVVLAAVVFAVLIPSIFKGLQEFWKLTATIGISFWLGVLWRRANSAGVFASWTVAMACMYLTRYVFGWGSAAQIALYLPAGAVAGVAASLATKPPSTEILDKFFTKLHTPIGQEELLEKSLDEAVPPENRLFTRWGLFLVKPSRETWGGFLIAWVVVALLIAGTWLLFNV